VAPWESLGIDFRGSCPRTALSGTIIEFLQRPSEFDKWPTDDALTDAILQDAILPEVRDSIVTQIAAASDPKLQDYIVYLLNVLVRQIALSSRRSSV
jgi:hypothetical protein